MIKVFDGEVFTCDLDKEGCESLLSFAASFEKPQNCMFLLLDEKQRVKGAMSVYDLIEKRKPIENVVLKDETGCFFDTANSIFRKECAAENQVLPLVNEQGECLALLQYYPNKIYGEKKEGTRYDSFENIHSLNENEWIDYSLCEKYDAYVFESYEEYTDCMIRLLKKRFPQKPIFCLDKKAGEFLKDIQIVSGVMEVEKLLQEKKVLRPMYITSDFENEYGKWPRYLTGTYCSLVVMKSLFWCANVEHFGEKNPEKTILLLDYEVEGSGLVDICKFTSCYIRMAKERGFIPVIHVTDQKGYFTEDSTSNFWELYFKPVSEISVSEAYESKNVIRASKNGIRLIDWEMNPYVYFYDSFLWEKAKNGEQIQHLICLNEEMLQYCETHFLKEQFEGKNILGVIARGTDYRKEALENRGSGNYVNSVDIETMISQCKMHLLLHGYEGIYLATEDLEYLEKFEASFSEEVLFYHPQKRGCLSDKMETVAEILKSNCPKEQTKQYIAILYSLAHCKELYASMECGAYLAGLTQRDYFL